VYKAPYAARWDCAFLLGLDRPGLLSLELLDWDRTGPERVGLVSVQEEMVEALLSGDIGSLRELALPVLSKEGRGVVGYDKLECVMHVRVRLVEDLVKQEALNASDQVFICPCSCSFYFLAQPIF
jgi:hypothetical protein